MGLTAVFFEFIASWDGSVTCKLSREVGRGNCMYQAFQDGKCLGTLFLEESADISRILQEIGVPEPEKWGSSHEKIPCNRAIRLSDDLRVASIEKIRGIHLISAGKRIDVNSADLEDLMAVPGIGPRFAEKIISRRQTVGRFSSIEELARIQGIGKKKLAGWGPYIEVRALGVVHGQLKNVETSGRLLEP
ncbi:MAG: ComEA family DNA-binding protein [Desulfomonilaceae bacterium]